jgi:hypothetical protein
MNINNEHFNDMIKKYDEIHILLKLDNSSNILESKFKWCNDFTHFITCDDKIFKKFKKRVQDVLDNIENINDNNLLLLIKNHIKTIKKNDIFWDNLHLIVLLNTMINNGDKHISKQLFKSIEKFQYGKDDEGNDIINDSLALVSNKQNNLKNKNVIDNLLGDLKTKLNTKDKFGIGDIFELTKELTNDYQTKLQNKEFSLTDVFSGIVDLVQNPQKIEDDFKDLNTKLDAKPEDLLKSVQEDPKLKDINNMMGDTFKDGKFNPMDMINNLTKNLKEEDKNNLMKGFETAKSLVGNVITNNSSDESNNLLNNLTGGNGFNPINMITDLLTTKKELSKEEIETKQKELEDFYSNLQV